MPTIECDQKSIMNNNKIEFVQKPIKTYFIKKFLKKCRPNNWKRIIMFRNGQK